MASRLPDKHGLEGLDFGQLGLGLDHRRHPLQAIHHLGVHRVRDPQRAVLVEGGQAGFGRHELRAGLVGGGPHKFDNGLLRRPLVPGGQRVLGLGLGRGGQDQGRQDPDEKRTAIFLRTFFPFIAYILLGWDKGGAPVRGARG